MMLSVNDQKVSRAQRENSASGNERVQTQVCLCRREKLSEKERERGRKR